MRDIGPRQGGLTRRERGERREGGKGKGREEGKLAEEGGMSKEVESGRRRGKREPASKTVPVVARMKQRKQKMERVLGSRNRLSWNEEQSKKRVAENEGDHPTLVTGLVKVLCWKVSARGHRSELVPKERRGEGEKDD